MSELIFDLKPIHYEMVNDAARYKVVIAGRRFNKTGILLAALAMHLAQSPVSVATGKPLSHSISYIAPTLMQAKAVFWERAKSVLAPLIRDVHESDHVIRFINGGRFRLWGSDVNPNAARGGYDTLQLFDEFAFHRPGVYDAIFRPKQSDSQASAWFVTTPNGFNHAYQFWQRGLEPGQSLWKSWQHPSVAGGYITESEVQSARRDMSENKWRQEYLAEFVGMENRVVLDWSYRNLDAGMAYHPDKCLYLSCDFNVNPMCWAIFQREAGEYHFIDEIAMRNTNVQKAAAEVAERYRQHGAGLVITGDASGQNRNYLQTRLSDTAYHQIANTLTAAGIPGAAIELSRRNPRIQDRLDAFNRMVKDGDGNYRVKVNPARCPVIAYSMEHAQYVEGSAQVRQPTQKEIETAPDMIFVPHMLDAVSYAINRYDPIERTLVHQKSPQCKPIRFQP